MPPRRAACRALRRMAAHRRWRRLITAWHHGTAWPQACVCYGMLRKPIGSTLALVTEPNSATECSCAEHGSARHRKHASWGPRHAACCGMRRARGTASISPYPHARAARAACCSTASPCLADSSTTPPSLAPHPCPGSSSAKRQARKKAGQLRNITSVHKGKAQFGI